ncbi:MULTISPECIES: hypothetical protein [Marinomonas]|uniref:Uncharacterized protein n=1 Tax=Marinomonas rhodophyticola TaxID=2992803 RepID=A0ABT3KHJ5_9GAMM|nr:hypothetical protein [Marinomonas sp. KJ51-3]MCW4629914.1 hypothetical protein [Marinomonas sp. KJ51-3]
MNSLATVALGAFAIIFFCAALIVGLVILKKYKAEQIRINELAKSRLEEKQKNK